MIMTQAIFSINFLDFFRIYVKSVIWFYFVISIKEKNVKMYYFKTENFLFFSFSFFVVGVVALDKFFKQNSLEVKKSQLLLCCFVF